MKSSWRAAAVKTSGGLKNGEILIVETQSNNHLGYCQGGEA